MILNVALMVCWSVLFAQLNSFGALTVGTIAFALVLVGLSFYLFLTIKEIQLNRSQANFVDSVTHELKTPLASIRLYLETLQLRELDDTRRDEARQDETRKTRQDQIGAARSNKKYTVVLGVPAFIPNAQFSNNNKYVLT